MLSTYLSDPESLYNNYVIHNTSFPRLCAAPIGVGASFIEVGHSIVNMVNRTFNILGSACYDFCRAKFVNSVTKFEMCMNDNIPSIVFIFVEIPNCAIRIILSVVNPRTTSYMPDKKVFYEIFFRLQVDVNILQQIDRNYDWLNKNAAKAPVLTRIFAIANCVIEFLGHVCMKPIEAGLYLKEAVVHFEIRDPRLSLYLVSGVVIALFQTIPKGVFAAPKCLLQCCASLYDPQHVTSIYQKMIR